MFLLTTPEITTYGDFNTAVALCLTTGKSIAGADSLFPMEECEYPVRPLPKKWEGQGRTSYRLWLVRYGTRGNFVVCPTLTSALIRADMAYRLFEAAGTITVCSIQG